MIRIALVGDFDQAVTANRAIPIALSFASRRLQLEVRWDWIHTASITDDPAKQLSKYDAIWCVPGSPYANAKGAIAAIRYARKSPRIFLGTCGGFQHAILEYAESCWGVQSPKHAETDPDAEDPVIAPLECALIEQSDTIHFVPESRLARIYGASSATEEYMCSYGLSPKYAAHLERSPLRVAAHDAQGDIRAIELDEHPFFIATLFQPERAALSDQTPVLVSSFISAAAQSRAAA